MFYVENVCSLALIDRHNGFFALIGTVFVAVFTGTLWKTTDRLVQISDQQRGDLERSIKAAERAATAAENNASAILGIERPVLITEDIKLDYLNTGSGLQAYPTVYIRNYGRTPAFVEEIILNISGHEILPDIPDYIRLNPFPQQFVIGNSDVFEYQECFIFQMPGIKAETIKQRIDAENSLFLYGIVFYRDFLNERFERGFIRGFAMGNPHSINCGGIYPQYDYQRPVKTQPRPVEAKGLAPKEPPST